MKRIQVLAAALVPAFADTHAFAQVNYVDKKISELHGFYDGADCAYFKLEGVAQADPVKPNEPFFAISRSQFGAKEAFATLLAAKVAGLAPVVQTRGNIVCGYAGVARIILQ